MTVIARTSNGTEIRASAGIFPPAGAATASFVLFGALGALIGMAYAAGEWLHLGGFGFPTDVGWTRLVFASNLANGRGLCFNPGVHVAGASGPAWLGLLAAGGYLLADFVGAAKLLGLWAVVLTAYLVWMITLDLLADWRFAFLAALATVTAPHFMAAGLGGTESALAALLLAATMHWQARSWDGARRQRLGLVLACGLAALCRPELGLLVPLIVLDRLLVTAVKRRPGTRVRSLLLRALPEALGAAALLAPYVFYNWRMGGPLWQQPDLALRGQTLFAWPATALRALWASQPLLLVASALGLPVAVLSAARARCDHSSFLLALTPVTLLLASGAIWREAGAANGIYTAAYLTPVISILGSAGLFLVYRACRAGVPFDGVYPERSRRAQGRPTPAVAGMGLPASGGNATLQRRPRAGGAVLAFGIAAVVCVLGGSTWFAHRAAWGRHWNAVKKVSNLQGAVGRWAAQHLASDASIASREVGAIGFYSGRRVVDLGGTIDRVGYAAMAKPGLPDDNLWAFLQQTKPSHVAIRTADFPYLSERTDLLGAVFTCMVTDKAAGGASTMTLYQTPWPSPSVRAAQMQGSPQ